MVSVSQTKVHRSAAGSERSSSPIFLKMFDTTWQMGLYHRRIDRYHHRHHLLEIYAEL